MRLELQTWNSINIKSSNIVAVIPPGQLGNLTANGVTSPRQNQFPLISGSNLPAHNITIEVYVQPGSNNNTYRELIKGYFNIQDRVSHDLVAYDLDNSNKPWFLRGIPVRVQTPRDNPTLVVITILVEMPVWRLVTAASDSWSITASGQTHDVTPIGNVNVPPKFTITPTVTKTGGLSYRRWVSIKNNLDTAYIWPIDITNGGLDTATLTTAKMQADGDDFRTWMDGGENDRWLYAMDTANTKCWNNIVLVPKQTAVLGANITSGAATEIELAHTKASVSFLQAMNRVTNKIVQIESEAFLFTAANPFTYKLTGVSYAQKGTAAAAHTAGVTVYWIEHDNWILYGDSTLTVPDTDDKIKPMFSLSSSNTSLIYSEFFDSTAAHPGAWKGEVNSTRTVLSYVFTDDENAFDNPATELGLSMNNSADETVVQQETAQLDWILTHPAGFTDVAYSGSKYSSNGSWPSVVGLQYLEPDSVWVTIQNEAAPADVYTWEAFSQTVDLVNTYNSIRFCMDGSLDTTAADSAMIQFNAVTLTLDNTKTPTIAVGAEQTINFFDFKLTNVDTGEYLTCRAPCPVNTDLIIDCENKLAYLSNGERVTLGFSSDRDGWLDLLPNIANTLKFEDTGTNAVTLVTSHRDRTM